MNAWLSEDDPSLADNKAGRAIAMILYSPVLPWFRNAPRRPFYERGVPWLRVLFLVMRTFPSLSNTIHKLSFIHFARWAIIRRIPDLGQPREHLAQPLLMFESNYNGGFDEYIDGFAYVLGSGMSQIWGTSYGFPGHHPVTPFKVYIRENEFPVAHYYSAYPEATVTMITSALAVQNALFEFDQRATRFEPDEFVDAYRTLLADIQGDL